MADRRAILVIGAGDATDRTIARRFAREEERMAARVETIARDVAPIEVAVFNIGANVRFGITEQRRLDRH